MAGCLWPSAKTKSGKDEDEDTRKAEHIEIEEDIAEEENTKYRGKRVRQNEIKRRYPENDTFTVEQHELNMLTTAIIYDYL